MSLLVAEFDGNLSETVVANPTIADASESGQQRTRRRKRTAKTPADLACVQNPEREAAVPLCNQTEVPGSAVEAAPSAPKIHPAPQLEICPEISPTIAVLSLRRPQPALRVVCRTALQSALRFWAWLQAKRESQLSSRRMCLCETVSLGEKRFLAIVKVDDQHFLVGGAPNSVSMLAKLAGKQSFAGLLRQRKHDQRLQA